MLQPLNRFQEINIQNMNVELVAQMFKNYQSNVLFHLEGIPSPLILYSIDIADWLLKQRIVSKIRRDGLMKAGWRSEDWRLRVAVDMLL